MAPLTAMDEEPSLSRIQYSLRHLWHERMYSSLQSTQVGPQPKQSRLTPGGVFDR